MGNHTAPFDAGCDNRLVHVPTGYINQTLLANTVAQATQKLGKESFASGTVDTSGEPSLFFRIVLADAASGKATLADVSGRIAQIFFEEIRPYENWGLTPYFSFRSESEQATLNDPDWA
jgi:hypothetical protein